MTEEEKLKRIEYLARQKGDKELEKKARLRIHDLRANSTQQPMQQKPMVIGEKLPISEQRETGVELAKGGIEGDKAALAGFMTTLDPTARMDIIKQNIPNAEFVQEGDITYVDLPFQDKKIRTVLNRPGMSGQDVQDFMGMLLQFQPAGKWASVGKTLLDRLAKSFAGGAATEAVRQVASVPAGSEQGVSPRQIAQTGAENVIGQGLGEGIGKGVSMGIGAAKDFAGSTLPLAGVKTKELLADAAGTTITPATEKTTRAAEKLAQNYDERFMLTPAEAAGSARLGQFQGRRGISEAGDIKLTEFNQGRLASEKAIINKFLDNLSPAGTHAARKARASAQEMIKGEKLTRASIAAPFYKAAAKQKLPENVTANLFQDPIIAEAANKVQSSPVWQKELKGSSLNDVKFLHVVKQAMDAMAEGSPSGEARVIRNSIASLNDEIAKVSPDYKIANKIYSVLSKNLEDLESSPIGAISSLDDSELKKVSQMIFDTAQTDSKYRQKIFADLSKNDKNAVPALMRAEMERRLGNLQGDITGSSFYRSVLAKDKDFYMFMDAARQNPEARRNLIWMRRAFENLIGGEGPKGAAFRSKSSLDAPRSAPQYFMDKVNDLAGGKYDKAAIEIITNPRWKNEVKAAFENKSSSESRKPFLELLMKVNASLASNSTKDNEDKAK